MEVNAFSAGGAIEADRQLGVQIAALLISEAELNPIPTLTTDGAVIDSHAVRFPKEFSSPDRDCSGICVATFLKMATVDQLLMLCKWASISIAFTVCRIA